MKRDRIADGEALPTEDGVDVTAFLGRVVRLPIAEEHARFTAYQQAWRANEEHPTLHHAAALVRAWNAYAELMRLERV